MDTTLTPIPKPEISRRVSNIDLLSGKAIPPIKRLQIISAEDYEQIIIAWIWEYLITDKKGEYINCLRSGGSGDKGRDIIAIVNDKENIYDNYQCKHYDIPISPSIAWLEIAKLCYYTYTKEYNLPRYYFFVAPKGCGSGLVTLLLDKEKLKIRFLESWGKLKDKIIKGKNIDLDSNLLKHIESIDFSIFKNLDPNQFIEEFKTTRYFASEFGGGLIKPRPKSPLPPPLPLTKELIYTRKLLDAYTDHMKEKIGAVKDLEKHIQLNDHFIRQRESFYTADSLNQFSRDTFGIDFDYFEELKDEIYKGVIDISNKLWKDGYERVVETIAEAQKLPIVSNPLSSQLRIDDKQGICHHLANDDLLTWVRN